MPLTTRNFLPKISAPRTFSRSSLRSSRSLPSRFPEISCDGIGFEIAYHVRVHRNFDYEAKEILVVVFAPADAFLFAVANDDTSQQNILNRSEIYVNGKEFGLALNQHNPLDLEAIGKEPLASSSDRPVPSVRPAANAGQQPASNPTVLTSGKHPENKHPQAMRAAMVTFFATAGQMDPFDLIGLPDFIPRITQWRVRALLRAFDQALDATIVERRRRPSGHPDGAAHDMLGIMLAARDPETGKGLSEAELKGNVLTFIFARAGDHVDGAHLGALSFIPIAGVGGADHGGKRACARRSTRGTHRAPARKPRRSRRGDAALSAHRRHYPDREQAGPARGVHDRARHHGGGVPLRAAPALPPVG